MIESGLYLLYHFFMNKQNWEQVEKKESRRAEKRLKKRKSKMKVSGAGVKRLGKLIAEKGR